MGRKLLELLPVEKPEKPMRPHTPPCVRRLTLLSVGVAFAASAAPAFADLLAYEGFNVDAAFNNVPLTFVGASGTGFVGDWTLSNGNASDSVYQAAGLSFPASYPGSFSAIGGHGVNKGNTANSNLRLNFSAETAAAVNSAPSVYISFLGQRQGQTVTEVGLVPDGFTTHEEWRTAGNLASEYPRSFGMRIMTGAATNNNSALGTIGKGSDWNSNGVTYGDPNPLLIDTWGVGGYNDVNNVYTGSDFTDGTDFVVVHVDTATSTYSIWINPQADGSADGKLVFQHTNGGVQRAFSMYAFGVEAGSASSNRPASEWVFDEIRIATTFDSAAGFTMIPEPSVLSVLAGLLAIGGLTLRRRR
jgi:hypothetical protein